MTLMTLIILTILMAMGPTGGNVLILNGKNITPKRMYTLLEAIANPVFVPMDSGAWRPSMTGSYTDRHHSPGHSLL